MLELLLHGQEGEVEGGEPGVLWVEALELGEGTQVPVLVGPVVPLLVKLVDEVDLVVVEAVEGGDQVVELRVRGVFSCILLRVFC